MNQRTSVLDHSLSVTLPSERELAMSRVFAAPARLVFDALTRPELLRRWYGPEGWTMLICEIDLRVGGSFRYVTRNAEGRDIEQRGVFREIVAPVRIVNTEVWADWNPGEVLVTTTLHEHAGKTTFTATSLYPSREVRDKLLALGMADGAEQTYEKLAAFLASAGPG